MPAYYILISKSTTHFSYMFCLRRSVLRTQHKNVLDSNVINITDLITDVYIVVHNITILFGS